MSNLVEYIFLDYFGNLRSKTKIVNFSTKSPVISDFPIWSYDGSSTGQASVTDSEIIMYPIKCVKSPFKCQFQDESDEYLVLCDTVDSYRSTWAKDLANREKLMFGFEQEFFIEEWMPDSSEKFESESNSYCRVGTTNSGKYRDLLHKILRNCIISGLKVTGSNLEVIKGQLEVQVCDYGLDACDSLLLTRYIICRTAESLGLTVNFNPSPPNPNCGGSGCHINFSTLKMRDCMNNPYDTNVFTRITNQYLERLKETHSLALDNGYYGTVKDRLTGRNETSQMDTFNWSTSNRSASVRIPKEPQLTKTFLLEDRRPSSDINPYLATMIIIDAVVPTTDRFLDP